jgi:hypothetical protein
MKLFLHIPWFIVQDDAIFALAKKDNGSLKYFFKVSGSVVQLVRIPVPVSKPGGSQAKRRRTLRIMLVR